MYSSDFKGKLWGIPSGETILGVYWDISEVPSTSFVDIPKGKYLYSPILLINEEVEDHMTQILFTLKENFIDIEGFLGWKSFSKEYLINICKEVENIYQSDWPNGNDFVSDFPAKINYFLESYCTIV
tara:strand:+ start:886 stop:1266 length:381 start_codon:yes stop_codon:yes gene_type:complete